MTEAEKREIVMKQADYRFDEKSSDMDYYKIKFYRDVMGINQKRLSEMLNISQGTLSKLESGVLDSEKYQKAIREIFDNWKQKRIKSLNDQIEYLNAI